MHWRRCLPALSLQAARAAVLASQRAGSGALAQSGGGSQDQKRIKALEQEVARKDQALAEAAALLMLEKKVRRLFADPADA